MSPSPDALELACARWLERPGLQLGTSLLLSVPFAIGSATQLYVNWSMSGLQAPFASLLLMKLGEFGLWAAAVPLVVAFDRRVDWSRGWPRAAAVHLALAVALFLVVNLAVTALMKVGREAGPLGYWDRYAFRMAYRIPSSWITYAAILAVVKLLQAFVTRQRLDRDLTRARLQVLHGQMQPHFLFNTLHTAASLVRAGDRQGAVNVLAALGDLLRRSLRHGRDGTVTLDEEIDFLERYLDIHRQRFGEHLAVTIDVPTELRTVPVPAFLLQPLVENAIRHGLDQKTGGEVGIVVRESGGTLTVRVEDSGGRLQALPSTEGDGIGLTNLRGRLAALYDGRATLRAGVDGGRSVVSVTFPTTSVPRPLAAEAP